MTESWDSVVFALRSFMFDTGSGAATFLHAGKVADSDAGTARTTGCGRELTVLGVEVENC